MADQDFSRIGELFYKEVGDEEKLSLEGFIKHAFTTYAQKYLVREGFADIKKVTYPSMRCGKMSLLVRPFNKMPDLSALQIESETKDFSKLLENLKGELSADFRALELKALPEQLRKKVIKSRNKCYAQTDSLKFYFSLDSKTPDLIKRIMLQQDQKNDLFQEYTPMDELDEQLTGVLSVAERVTTKYSFYTDKDPNKELINEYCNITQPRRGTYSIDYSIKAVNNKSLPAHLFRHLNIIFELVKDDFNTLSYQRMKVEDPASNIGVYVYG